MSRRRNKSSAGGVTTSMPVHDGVPEDGVMFDTRCMSTRFLKNTFRQTGPHKARISASVEYGTFSIRDLETNTMLTVAIQDAAYAMSEAVNKAKKLEAVADCTAESAAQPIVSPTT